MSTVVDHKTRWSLSDLFPAGEEKELEVTFQQVNQQVTDFEQQRTLLVPDMPVEKFLGLIRDLEVIQRLASRISGFASLHFAENTQNQDAQALVARIDQFMAELSNRVLFFSLWWKGLDDTQAQRLMSSAGDYRYWLQEMRQFKKYTLTEPEEKIINIKDVTGANALTTLYDSITNRYTFKLKVDGKIRKLTRGELMVYVRQSDPNLRRDAYRELYRIFGDEGPILGQIYQAITRDWRNEQVNLRGFSSPLAARNLINDIPDDVTDTLLYVCRENAPVFQRFFRLKASLLGIDRLRRYDLYAPITRSDKSYPYHKATDLVLDSFDRFDRRFADMARRVFDQGHLDSEVRKGKRHGAFCSSILPEMTPWVLLNYQGKVDDVATMAHELGHAIHSMLASQHSLFTFHACLPLAETASTFGEMMLVDRLLQEEKDPIVRRDLLFRQIDDSYATIQRQAYFAMFERQAHEMINQNARTDEISAAYLENLRQQFGDSIDLSDEFRWEWVSIPHFYHVPFYVYAYAFGQLLVLSLYQQYRVEGDAFKPRYLKILSAGGSIAPVNLLQDAGIDIHQASFWQGGYDVISGLIDQLEKGN